VRQEYKCEVVKPNISCLLNDLDPPCLGHGVTNIIDQTYPQAYLHFSFLYRV